MSMFMFDSGVFFFRSTLHPTSVEGGDILSITLINIQKDLNQLVKHNVKALTHEVSIYF